MQTCKLKERDRAEFELLGPIHPGEMIRDDVLPRLRLSRRALAHDLDVSYSTVTKLLSGRRRVSPNLAVGLARISGTSVLYWLVLQAHHDAWIAQRHALLEPRRRVLAN